MADPEHRALHRAESHTQRQVELLRRVSDERVRVEAGRHDDRGQRVGMLLGPLAEDAEAERADGAPARLGQAGVPREHVGQPLVAQHRQRLPQPEQQHGGRRVWKLAPAVALEHRPPVPERARTLRLLRRRQRALARGEDGHSRRQHQTLLRPGEGDVHTPGVEPEVDRRQRRDRVHQQQRGMARVVERGAHGGDVRCARRGSPAARGRRRQPAGRPRARRARPRRRRLPGARRPCRRRRRCWRSRWRSGRSRRPARDRPATAC